MQEIIIPEGRECQLVLQAPRRLDESLWLTIGGGIEDTTLYDPVHTEEAARSPYQDLLDCGGLADGSCSYDRLVCSAEGFGSRWGLPQLPKGFFQHFVFREMYCFRLDEFFRMARLVSALGRLLQARYAVEHRKETLYRALAQLAATPLDKVIPRDGCWPQPATLRGGKSRIWYFQTMPIPAPPFDFPPDLVAQFSKSHIPEGYRRAPYNPIVLLPDRLAGLTGLSALQRCCDEIRLGVKACVEGALSAAAQTLIKTTPGSRETHAPSLWSFILDEWVRRYDRRGRRAYCCHSDPDGTPCGARLPQRAPANRRYCSRHQGLRARERKRDHARRRRGGSGIARRADEV